MESPEKQERCFIPTYNEEFDFQTECSGDSKKLASGRCSNTSFREQRILSKAVISPGQLGDMVENDAKMRCDINNF